MGKNTLMQKPRIPSPMNMNDQRHVWVVSHSIIIPVRVPEY